MKRRQMEGNDNEQEEGKDEKQKKIPFYYKMFKKKDKSAANET